MMINYNKIAYYLSLVCYLFCTFATKKGIKYHNEEDFIDSNGSRRHVFNGSLR